MIHLVCPSCATKLGVPDNAANRKTKCPRCKAIISVPPDPGVRREPEPVVTATLAAEHVDRPRRKSRQEEESCDEERPRKQAANPWFENRLVLFCLAVPLLLCCCIWMPMSRVPPRENGGDVVKQPEPKGQTPPLVNENEINRGGLVLLKDTLNSSQNEFSIEITGTVINRRPRRLAYAEINFNIYDASGAQIGSAMANINGLEPDGRWNFRAVSFAQRGAARWTFSSLSGF